MTITALTDRAIARISGKDAHSLLQGIITNNMALLESQPALFTALLSAQGKFAYDFFLVVDGDALLLDAHKDAIAPLLKLLTMYRLRADVSFERLDDYYVYALNGSDGNGISYDDPRHPDLGKRLISSHALDGCAPCEDYHEKRLQLGIPDGYVDAIANRSILLELGYDKLHAIDFHKGCYIGQEVTARSKHRGQLRKYLHQVTGEQLPQAGAEIITEDGNTLGEMRSSSGNHGLAIIRVEPLQEAHATNQAILAGGHSVTVAPLFWMGNNDAA